MPPAPILRTARPDDLPALSELAFRSKAHWGYDAQFMEACREELMVPLSALSSDVVRLAEVGHAPVAFYHLCETGNPAELEVDALFVVPECIGTGLGQLLWDDLEAAAAKRSATRLVVQSDPYAEGFYQRMGMVRIGERPSESISGRTLPLLEKPIPGSDPG